jgi:hypothetical protein
MLTKVRLYKNMSKRMHLRNTGCKRRYGLLKTLIMIVLFLGIGQDLFGQAASWPKKNLTRGKVWITINNAGSLGPLDIPWSYYSLDYPGHSSGIDNSDKVSYIDAGGYAIYGEREGTAAAYTITGRFTPATQYVRPTVPTVLKKNYNMEDPSLLAEEIVTGSHHVISLDVDIAQKSMVWSYPKYDDFVIHEFTITNTDSIPLTDVYFGIRRGILNSVRGILQGPGETYDDKYGWSDEHNIFYFYDDRSFTWEDEVEVSFSYGPGPITGDIGDPNDLYESGAQNHELLSPGYMTSIVLDSAGANVYRNIITNQGQGTAPGEEPAEDRFAYLTSSLAEDFKTAMTHQQPRMSWDEARAAGDEGGNKFERNPEYIVSVGPLSIDTSASVKLVFADVLGEMDRARIVEGGVENVNLLATASRDSLFANVAAARELYAAGYDAADPPPSPTNGENSLTFTPLVGGMDIAWPPISESYTDPDNGMNDLAGYRVYRSTYFTTGPWELVDDIPKDELITEGDYAVYQDMNRQNGVGLYYGVTSYDNDGNESGLVNANRYPVYPIRAPNDEFDKRIVHVVPNPFRQHSGLTGSGEDLRMEFINIPAVCTIRIYTLAGDLVKTIEHDDGSGAQAWGSIVAADYQTNKWFLHIAPGFYVYHVESRAEGTKGESFVGKFAIIR